jgi:hypothetical protein
MARARRPGTVPRITAVHYGIVAGLAAVAAEAFFGVTQPPAYGICLACHGADTLNWTLNHLIGTHLQVAAVSRNTPLLTTAGVIIGAVLAAARNREWRWIGTGSPLRSLALGAVIVICALTVLGCPTRLWLRLAYGDPLAVVAVAALMAGIAAGTAALRWQAARV